MSFGFEFNGVHVAEPMEVEEVKYDGAVSGPGGGGCLQADESDCLRWIKSEAEVNAQHTECAFLL